MSDLCRVYLVIFVARSDFLEGDRISSLCLDLEFLEILVILKAKEIEFCLDLTKHLGEFCCLAQSISLEIFLPKENDVRKKVKN
ncbi:hypothetical protein CKA32_000153 [Geitlerinema sp. FC II]|nr:hypothetical protein CKA32_000153 [Geitlerinema sp. FC II]